MAKLIDDMLNLSRITRSSINFRKVDLSALVRIICEELKETDLQRSSKFIIATDLVDIADPTLIRAVLQNLLENAWKFTSKKTQTTIEFGIDETASEKKYFVRDNGAGFNMRYADKLFTPFQRLHQTTDFAGTGVGLAIVQRIIHRHGGNVWAEGEVDKGATFYFTLNALKEF